MEDAAARRARIEEVERRLEEMTGMKVRPQKKRPTPPERTQEEADAFAVECKLHSEISTLEGRVQSLEHQLEEAKKRADDIMARAPLSDRLDESRITVERLPCVYLLFRDGVCVYVGQSDGSLLSRLGNHMGRHSKKVFDTAIWFTCPKRKLNKLEGAAIWELKPEYNIKGRGRGGPLYQTEAEAREVIAKIWKKHKTPLTPAPTELQ